jgi:ADP-ribose pyrophosphatase
MPDPIEATTAWQGNLFSVQILRIHDAEGREHVREVVRHPGAVAIVAVLDDGTAPRRIVLIRNRRAAVDRRLWEVPAGKLEPGEPPIEAASRELREETGFRAATVRPLGRFFTSPGFSDELMHVFVAETLEAGPMGLEPGEDIQVEAVPVDEVFAMVGRGEIEDGKTIAALLLWERARDGREA